jgi:hypothetical protein
MSVLDDNIKIGIKETIFVFRQISSLQYSRTKFLEKFMKLLCIKQQINSKILQLGLPEDEFRWTICLDCSVKIFQNC